jgi:hypothetical protein
MPLTFSRSRQSSVALVAGTAVVSTAATVLAAALTLGAPAHAAADGTGVIRGTVLETGHVIAPGIDVSLYKSSGEFVAATVANSEAGAYAFSDLPAGSYTLWFENQNEAVSEWYDNQPDKPQATVITLGEGATFVANAYLTQVSENLVAPTISGTAAVGSTLTATRGTWYPTALVEFRYQWLRGGSPVEGATQQSYVVREADSGFPISVQVIAVNQGATESATSLSTAAVTGGTPVVSTIGNVAPPVISGSVIVGSVLSSTAGTWSPADASVGLEWLRGATVVGTGPTYTTTPADVGTSLQVRATASKSGWTARTVTGSAFGPITSVTVTEPPVTEPPVLAPSNSTRPVVGGTMRVGSTLTATAGGWSNAPTGYRYQWTRNGAAIPGATSARLVLTSAQVGSQIGITVSASNTAGTTLASSATRSVAKATSAIAAQAVSPKKGRLRLTAGVTSAGSASGKVTLTVRVGGRTVTKTLTLRGGRASLTLKGLRSGRAKVTVRYRGSASAETTQVARSVKVR